LFEEASCVILSFCACATFGLLASASTSDFLESLVMKLLVINQSINQSINLYLKQATWPIRQTQETGDSVAQWLASRIAAREVMSSTLPCAPVAQ